MTAAPSAPERETSPALIAVLIPCYNEALTIGKVVEDFRRQLPQARICVYDNSSSDDTAARAHAAGAEVVSEKHRGKGHVIAAMLRDVDADFYVMVDGDDTYPASHVQLLLAPVVGGRADIVVGNRLVTYAEGAYRPLHVFGNRLVVSAINVIFGTSLSDAMSGYRAFNREVAQRVPVVSRGFEVETEMTLQALYRGLLIVEVPVPYGRRPEGSFSKLSTYRDGARVLVKIVDIFKAYRPLLFFSIVALVLALVGLALGAVPVIEFLRTGMVRRFPTAILAAALEVMALVAVSCGVILDSVNHHFRELSQLILQATRRDPHRSEGTAGRQ